jgi:hypothetical protein
VILKIGISDDAEAFVESEAEIVSRALAAYRFLEYIAQEDGQVILKRNNGGSERLGELLTNRHPVQPQCRERLTASGEVLAAHTRRW